MWMRIESGAWLKEMLPTLPALLSKFKTKGKLKQKLYAITLKVYGQGNRTVYKLLPRELKEPRRNINNIPPSKHLLRTSETHLSSVGTLIKTTENVLKLDF